MKISVAGGGDDCNESVDQANARTGTPPPVWMSGEFGEGRCVALRRGVGNCSMKNRWRRTFSNTRAVMRAVRAQVADGPEKERLLSLLIERIDFPDGDWKVFREFAHPVGASGSSAVEINLARRRGNVTVTRAFKSDLTNRLVITSIVPFVSETDAWAYLPKSMSGIRRPPRYFWNVAEIKEGYVDGHEVRGLPSALFYEVQYQGSKGARRERIVAGVIENMLVMVNFESTGELWSWQEVVALTELQVAKIREHH